MVDRSGRLEARSRASESVIFPFSLLFLAVRELSGSQGGVRAGGRPRPAPRPHAGVSSDGVSKVLRLDSPKSWIW